MTYLNFPSCIKEYEHVDETEGAAGKKKMKDRSDFLRARKNGEKLETSTKPEEERHSAFTLLFYGTKIYLKQKKKKGVTTSR